MASPMILVFGVMSIDFSSAYTSHAITAERSVARRHLYNQGRSWPSFPGLNFSAVYTILAVSITALATRIVANETLDFPALDLIKLLVGLLLANLHTASVHAIISKPNKKSFWQRIPGWREWIETMPAASLDLASPKCVYHLTQKLLAFLRQSSLPTPTHMPIALEFLTSILTRAIYIRVAASLLPDDDETIIPFDPSFGGRVRNNEAHCLGILDAINTMSLQNWHHYRRIVRECFNMSFPSFACSSLLWL